MIDSGGLFAALRERVLLSIPAGSQPALNTSNGIADWLKNGTYLVTSCTKAGVTLQISHVDFASALLAETENFLNHCLEHVEELVCGHGDTRQRSDAWATVTAYYLGFFATSVLLRLVGSPVVFLTREQLKSLQAIAGSVTVPSQGAFRFTVGAPVSAIYTELRIIPTQKIHEATWKQAFVLIDGLRNDPALLMQADEADFYSSLCTQSFFSYGIGYDWPSSVRNQANYRAGYVYRLLRPEYTIRSFLESWRLGNKKDVYQILREVYARCNAGRDIFAHSAEMMTNVSIVFYLLARALYRELVDRRLTDRRWEQQRNVYRRSMSIAPDEFEPLKM